MQAARRLSLLSKNSSFSDSRKKGQMQPTHGCFSATQNNFKYLRSLEEGKSSAVTVRRSRSQFDGQGNGKKWTIGLPTKLPVWIWLSLKRRETKFQLCQY